MCVGSAIHDHTPYDGDDDDDGGDDGDDVGNDDNEHTQVLKY
jgi:hypothetical protein